MRRRGYLYSICFLFGILGAWGAHHRIVRIAPAPQMACVGWTVYLNLLLGFDSTNPDFEARELGLLNDPESARFLQGTAAEVRSRLGDRLSNVHEVYLVPFQESGLKKRGFPFASSMPYSVVYLNLRDGQSEEVRVSERGSAPFRLVGFLGNSLLYAALLVCVCIYSDSRTKKIRARHLAMSTGFPVIEVAPCNGGVSSSTPLTECDSERRSGLQ